MENIIRTDLREETCEGQVRIQLFKRRSNALLRFHKSRKFNDLLSDYEVVKQDPVSWS